MSYEEFLKSDKAVKDSSSYGKRKNKEYYQQYVAEHSAELDKNQQLDTLEKDKSTALRENDIVTERAKRYLNAVALKNGIQGTGYAEAKTSDLYAQEASRRTEINNAYNKQKNDALNIYQQTVASAKATAAQNLGIIEEEEKLYNEQQAENDRIEVLQQMESNRALYESGELDYEGFAKYYNENKGKLDSTKDSTIIGVYDNIIARDATKGKKQKIKSQNDIVKSRIESETEGKPNDYIKEMEANAMNSSTSAEWSVRGLGSGRNNDDLWITISGTEYHVNTSGPVRNDELSKRLNEIATGSKDKTPSAAKTHFGGAFGGDNKSDSTSAPGKVVVYKGEMYIYTSHGWSKVKNNGANDDDTQAIAAFLKASSSYVDTQNDANSGGARTRDEEEALMILQKTKNGFFTEDYYKNLSIENKIYYTNLLKDNLPDDKMQEVPDFIKNSWYWNN